LEAVPYANELTSGHWSIYKFCSKVWASCDMTSIVWF